MTIRTILKLENDTSQLNYNADREKWQIGKNSNFLKKSACKAERRGENEKSDCKRMVCRSGSGGL